MTETEAQLMLLGPPLYPGRIRLRFLPLEAGVPGHLWSGLDRVIITAGETITAGRGADTLWLCGITDYFGGPCVLEIEVD